MQELNFNPDLPTLAYMSVEKVGDFLLLTPALVRSQNLYPSLTVAVPDLLWGLYSEQRLFSDALPNSQVSTFLANSKKKYQIINLSFPLLNHPSVGADHLRLKSDYFLKPQHASESYFDCLKEYFPKLDLISKPEPFLDFDPETDTLARFGLRPFSYYTIHTGSDFSPKNWKPENFEKTIQLIHQTHQNLVCVNLIGPQDEEIFQNQTPPQNFKVVKTNIRDVAHILAGSVFHIDNDSGIHHLAGALDVPSVTVFGPTPPGTWTSLTSKNFVHWGRPQCLQICESKKVWECSDRICLSAVKPAHLLQSVHNILAQYQDLPL